MFAKKMTTAVSAALLAVSAIAFTAPVSEAFAGPLSWMRGERVQGSGHIVKQARDVAQFSGLALSVSAKVDVKLGNSESIVIEADDNILPLLETVVEDGTLRIRPNKKDLQLDSRNIRVAVTTRKLQRISVGGSGSVTAADLRGEKLGFDLGGSGSIDVRDLKAEQVSASLGGSGKLTVSGKAERVDISIGGSGKVNMGQLAVQDASVSIGGSGDATVNASKALSVSVAGSGDVGYYGDPQISKSVVGSGGVKRLGSAP